MRPKILASVPPKVYRGSYSELFASEGFRKLISDPSFQRTLGITVTNEFGDGIVAALLNRTLDHVLKTHGVKYSQLSLAMRMVSIGASQLSRVYNAPGFDQLSQEFRASKSRTHISQNELDKTISDLKKTMVIDVGKMSLISAALYVNESFSAPLVIGLVLAAQTLEVAERFLEGPIFHRSTINALKLDQKEKEKAPDYDRSQISLTRVYGENNSKIKVLESVLADIAKYSSVALGTFLLVDSKPTEEGDQANESSTLNMKIVGVVLFVALALILAPKYHMMRTTGTPMPRPSEPKEKTD